VPFCIVERRPGDIAQCYADPMLAKRLLGWSARFDLAQMCVDAWNWQRNNPQGYV
jgi:UDP-glucose 4-epimerase